MKKKCEGEIYWEFKFILLLLFFLSSLSEWGLDHPLREARLTAAHSVMKGKERWHQLDCWENADMAAAIPSQEHDDC